MDADDALVREEDDEEMNLAEIDVINYKQLKSKKVTLRSDHFD